MPRKAPKLKNTEPPIRIAYQIERAAEALDEPVSHLEQAISDGRLKVVRKKAAGRGRGVTLILAEELFRFAKADELAKELPAGPSPQRTNADGAKVTWDCMRRCVVFDATTISVERGDFHNEGPVMFPHCRSGQH